MTTSVSDLQAENAALESRLERVRERRRSVAKLTGQVQQQEAVLMDNSYNTSQQALQENVEEYAAILLERNAIDNFLNLAKQWNVVNDCFHIWISGSSSSFATINGCRLGAEAAPLGNDLRVRVRVNNVVNAVNINVNQHGSGGNVRVRQPQAADVDDSSQKEDSNAQPQQQQPQGRRYFGFFQGNEANGNNNGNCSSSNSTPSSPPRQRPQSPTPPQQPQQQQRTRVPWLEVNAALGHACLLLKLLQETSSLRFTHDLYPMGVSSEVAIRFGASQKQIQNASPINYKLYLDEDAANSTSNTAPSSINPFAFFKNSQVRNFNYALQAFLQCVLECSEQFLQRDRTMMLPHPIECIKDGNNNNFLNGGQWMIGGLSICYPSAAGSGDGTTSPSSSNPSLEWTRACKYLLTDLKWLVAFSAKHVDR